MARLCDPIVSPALSGKSLEIGVGVVKDIQTNQASANAEGYTLDCMLDEFMKQRRQELRDEAFDVADMNFGTVECDGEKVALLGQAELTNRLFDGCYSDASYGESYISEWSCTGINRNGERYEITWRFEEVKGSELEDASSYDWSKYEIKQV